MSKENIKDKKDNKDKNSEKNYQLEVKELDVTLEQEKVRPSQLQVKN